MPEGRAAITSKQRARKGRLRVNLPTALRVIRLRDFGWVVVLVGLFVWLKLSGTPHFLFKYQYAGTQEHKISCTYVGLNSQTILAELGGCQVFKFLKAAN